MSVRRSDGEGAMTSSMTDLMTSLAVVFILLLVAYLNQAYMENKRKAERYRQVVAHSKSVKSDLIRRFKRMGLDATSDPKDPLAIIIPISEAKIQFDKGQSVLKPIGTACLQQFTPQLAQVISNANFAPEIESVLIEGHTDSDGEDEDNLRLSQDRSYAVLRCVLNECGLRGEQRGRLLDLVSANGRGERHTIIGADGHENKAASRRVVFKIRLKSIEQKHVVLS